MSILVKNGVVYDPKNGVEGEVVDIVVEGEKVVESVDESQAQVIDASGMLVMPGGVDLHSHIAGSKVNSGRLLRPEDHYSNYYVKDEVRRSGVGRSVPSTFVTGYEYAILGFTTVFEAASPPLKSVHTHDELNDIPIVDKACYPLYGNNWFVMDAVSKGDMDECTAYVAWLMEAVKGYAVKIVDPGCVEAWKWGETLEIDRKIGTTEVDEQIPEFGITPRDIIRSLCEANRRLKMPHAIHVHANGLGLPGNYPATLETLRCVEDLAKDGEAAIHLTHAQFNSYGGVDYASIASAADKIADYVNKHSHVTLDMGQVTFTDTTTMTGDGPFEYRLAKLTGSRWVNGDVEVEEGSGIVPVRYKKNNYAHAVMWTIGLELALLVKDPWKVFVTTDHPNGGPFTYYPRVYAWLMSTEARERILKKLPRLTRVRTNLASIDREYTLNELVIGTRAAPAKALGLKSKGHLGVGADADISIYNINPKETDPSKDWRKLRKALRRTAYTIKDGRVVVKEGKVVEAPIGRTYWVKPSFEEGVQDFMKNGFKERFEDFYTVKMENYQIPETFLPRPAPLTGEAST